MSTKLEKLQDAAFELVSVADQRGDSDLPHPSNDVMLWTGRMLDAWNEMRKLLEEQVPGQLEKLNDQMRKAERLDP